METAWNGPGDYRAETLERLRFRRQFLLAPRGVALRPGWRAVELDGGLRLQVHPDLPLTRAADGPRSLTLLGDLLDADRPEATNADLAGALLGRMGRAGELHRETGRLGGRWVLLGDDGRARVLLHDACGLRQVCYGRAPGGEMVCASQPGLLAEALGLRFDPEAVAFMATRVDHDGFVYWMPGDTTMYRELRALLPNHQLDLSTGQAHRFGPGALPPPTPAGEAVVEVARQLRGLIEAARRRSALSLPLTAGWDSRLMLAAARDQARQLFCYTLDYPDVPPDATDVAVPRRLLARLGLEHHLVHYPRAVHPGFKAIQKAGTTSAKAPYCADAQAMHEALPPGRTCLTGDVAEIFKCYYRLPGRAPGEVTAADLCALTQLGDHPFAVGAYQRWLAGAAGQPLHPLDLFAWEQVAGRWQAAVRAEYDLVQESLAPLDVRALLELLLSVDEAQRRPPDHPLLRALLERLWADVLAEPINPPEPLRLRALVGRVLRRLHLHHLIPGRQRRPGPPPAAAPGGESRA
jgi:hypothetical protein